MLSRGIVLIALGGLSACATAPESLTKAQNPEQIVLSERVSTVAYRGLHVRCEEGALPGTYVAKFEDAKGIYFYGPERSIWSTNEAIQKTPRLYVGGLYVPRDRSRSPQFFYVFEKDIHTADNIDTFLLNRASTAPLSGSPVADGLGNAAGGAIVNAIIDSGVGKIEKFPPIEDPLIKQKILDARQVAPQ
jgi:hypothetical protein